MKFWKYIKPDLAYFILGPLFMLTEVAGEVVLPYLMASSLEYGVAWQENGSIELFGKTWSGYPYVFLMGGLMLAISVLMLVGGMIGSYCSVKASTGFAMHLRRDAFYKVQEFSFNNIDHFSTGSLVTRLTNDVTQLQNVIRMGLVMLLRAPGMMIGAMIMARKMNPSLSTVIFAVLPVMVVVIVLMMKAAFPRFNVMQAKLDKLNSSIRENLTNVRVIKSLVREPFENKKFEEANTDLMENSLRAFNIMIFVSPLMTLFMNGTTLIVVYVGGRQSLVGDMQVEKLSAFMSYIFQILFALIMTSMVILNSSRAMASAKRLKEVINEEVDLTDYGCEMPEAEVKRGDIEFKDVTFAYYKTGNQDVLHGVNLKINAGETVGIIGSTGSGKTSLVQLIPRLYDADAGEVLVDGINVKKYSLKNLRSGVAMVLQKNVLFSGTIEENLRWGDESASEERLKEASVDAQADLFVSNFKEGYETELGQGGVNLSGGQKQRLCIARALLKHPKILILDDSTSAVDTATEAKIRHAFKKNYNDTTKLIIAQRISSVIDADKIVVLDNGNIVGMGKHEELIESCETYQEIYYSQRDKEEKK